MIPETLRDDLITLSHELGRESRQFALLGEGQHECQLRRRHLLGQGVGWSVGDA